MILFIIIILLLAIAYNIGRQHAKIEDGKPTDREILEQGRLYCERKKREKKYPRLVDNKTSNEIHELWDKLMNSSENIDIFKADIIKNDTGLYAIVIEPEYFEEVKIKWNKINF